MEKRARLFIAIELSEKQRKEITSLQNTIRHYCQGVRWVRSEQLHLTLKFLGDTNSDHISQVKLAMDESAASLRQFQVRYGGCGVFPSVQKARVIWIGLKEGKVEIANFAQVIDQALTSRGFKAETRSLQPHLTIGRITRSLPKKIIEQFLKDEQSFESSSHTTGRFTLFESHLTESRAIHTPLYRAALG